MSPWNEILAGLFGVGAGFTLDEFALWIYLRDVYWAQEGRKSFDAVIVATVLGGLVLLGLAPFNVKDNSSSIASLVIAVSVDFVLALLVILKGKPLLGLACVFVPIIVPFGLFRLASPTSVWARRLLPNRRSFDAPLDRPLEADRRASGASGQPDRRCADRDRRQHRAGLATPQPRANGACQAAARCDRLRTLNRHSVFPRRRVMVSVAVVIALCAFTAPPVLAAGTSAPRTLTVGSLTLHRCGPHRGSDHGPGWCTKVPRPLDPGLPGGPKIGIQTQWVPAQRRPRGRHDRRGRGRPRLSVDRQL